MIVAQVAKLGHVRIFVRRVLGSLNILLVNQHLDALLDDGDGGGESCLQQCNMYNYKQHAQVRRQNDIRHISGTILQSLNPIPVLMNRPCSG